MTILAIIEFLLLMNMVLFVLVFSLLAPPPGLLQLVIDRFSHPEMPLEPPESAEHLARNLLRFYGLIGCGALFGWTVLTGFVLALYRGGFFRSF